MMKANVISLALCLCVALEGGCAPPDAPPEDWASAGLVAGNIRDLGEVRLVAAASTESGPPKVELVLQNRAGEAVYRLPEFWANREYAYYETREAAFADIDHDGLEDIAIIAEYVTGIGPTGAEPFAVAGIYLRRGSGFEPATDLESLVNGTPRSGTWNSIDELVDAAVQLQAARE